MFSSIIESEKLRRGGEEGGMVLLEGELDGDGDADLKNKFFIFDSSIVLALEFQSLSLERWL